MNIREFAALCGVSASAASRILNKSQKESRASQSTYDRVRAKAIAVGFRPDYAAKILHTRRSNCIGVVVGHPSLINSVSMVRGISHCAYRHGFSLSVAGCNNNPRLEKKAFDDMLYRQVDAIIWHPVMRRDPHDYAYLEKKMREVTERIPVISLSGNSLPNIGILVTNGDEDAASAARRQLNLGCKKFATIRSAFRFPAIQSALASYTQELLAHGIPPENVVEIVTDNPRHPVDWSVLADVDGVWIFFPFMLHFILPNLVAHCDLKQLHIDGQSFVEDYSLTKITSADGQGNDFSSLFGSLCYHLLNGTKIVEQATEVAIRAINNPGQKPGDVYGEWQVPPYDFSLDSVLLSSI